MERLCVHVCVYLCVCVCQKNDQALALLKPWTAVLALLGLISKVQIYARAWETLLIYKQMDSS